MSDLSSARIGQIAVVVKDVERAIAFYRDRLGLPFLFQFPGLGFFQAGEVRLMLSRAEKPEFDHPASIMYLKVSDIEGTHATLGGRGVEFTDQPHIVHRDPKYELWMTFFRDGEGNTLALMSEKPIT